MKLVRFSIAFAAVLTGGVAMAAETSLRESVVAKTSLRRLRGGKKAFPDTTVPGSGYGCERPTGCRQGESNCYEYVLRPEIKTFTIKNSAKFFNTSQDVEFVTRTWSADLNRSNFNDAFAESVCGTYDNENWILGPCLTLHPGSITHIRLENEMDLAAGRSQVKKWLSSPPNPEEYVALEQPGHGAYAFLEKGGFEFKGRPEDMEHMYGIPVDIWGPGQEWNYSVAAKAGLSDAVRQDTPGSDTTFERVNLHLHGMEVVPHLFHPVGTSDPEAPWIETIPDSQITDAQRASGLSKCYTYNFTIPDTHPSGGTYWYHTHRHGAVAMQTWSGMAGLALVPGEADKQLKADYGVSKEQIFVIWDPHLVKETRGGGQPDIVQVGKWLDNQNDVDLVPFLVNNEYQPTLTMEVGELVRYRVLCATTENMCGFRIIKIPQGSTEDEVCSSSNQPSFEPFYRIGSDGILFDHAPQNMDQLVLGGGQREEILVRLDQEGTYAVCQTGLNTKQFFGSGPGDQALATIQVTAPGPAFKYGRPVVNISKIRLVPGIAAYDSINAVNVRDSNSLVFNMASEANAMPFPQFQINSQSYTVKSQPMETFWLGEVQEITLYNAQKTVHPFHIHVNTFQVQEVVTAFSDDDFFGKYLTHQAVGKPWRDTVLIPPQGHVRIWVRAYNHYVGKTAFHCHFLAHEDTGMIGNMMITYDEKRCKRANALWANSCDVKNNNKYGNLPKGQ